MGSHGFKPLVSAVLLMLFIGANGSSARAQGFYGTQPYWYGGQNGYYQEMVGYTYGNLGGMNPYQALPGLYNRNYFFGRPDAYFGYAPYYGYGPVMNYVPVTGYLTPTQSPPPQVIEVKKNRPLKKLAKKLSVARRNSPMIVHGPPY